MIEQVLGLTALSVTVGALAVFASSSSKRPRKREAGGRGNGWTWCFFAIGLGVVVAGLAQSHSDQALGVLITLGGGLVMLTSSVILLRQRKSAE